MTRPDRSSEKYELSFFNMALEKFIDKNHEPVLFI